MNMNAWLTGDSIWYLAAMISHRTGLECLGSSTRGYSQNKKSPLVHEVLNINNLYAKN